MRRDAGGGAAERPTASGTGDPAAPGLECPPFVIAPTSDGVRSVFDNGLPVQATAWINDGVLAALQQSRHSAALTELPLTPPVDNLNLEVPSRQGTLANFIAQTKRGVLLTSPSGTCARSTRPGCCSPG